MAPPKKSGRALMREEGLERTDNRMPLTSWPVVPMINQKNYYTEYLKRDDQIMVYREQQERALRDELEKAQKAAQDPMAAAAVAGDPAAMESEAKDEAAEEEAEVERFGSKIIVIHPGSQNLRLGLASDALPKSIPNVIARRAEKSESEIEERCPKRVKLDAGEKGSGDEEDESAKLYMEPEVEAQITTMSNELKLRMRQNKRRMLPNSKELVLSYNRRTLPETIREHNDPYRVEWTEVNPEKAKEYYVGDEALRIPDVSNPRYRLYWPIRYGWFNEKDYDSKKRLLEDFQIIIEEGIRTQLGIPKKDLGQYRVVLVVPDLYERNYTTDMVEMLMKEVRFDQICVIQESLAATFGAGFSQACIVDIGAQKTSVCCVEEGMCVAESRVNIKYGGQDVTEALLKMLLLNSFPYKEINLRRRYDFLLAETLKIKLATLNDGDVVVQAHDFHLRRPDQDTKKYSYKCYDEVMLAPITHFRPSLWNHQHKLLGRRSVWERSYDLYDGMPNDPMSTAQAAMYQSNPRLPPGGVSDAANGLADTAATSTPARPSTFGVHLTAGDQTPRSSVAGSPGPENGTPMPGMATPSIAGEAVANGGGSSVAGGATSNGLTPSQIALRMWEEYDRTVPIMPLDKAIVESINHAAKGDEKKVADFLASVMIVGGGSAVSGLNHYLEERIRVLKGIGKDWSVIIGVPPRELDPQVIVWKGASVYGKLRITNDSWIGQREYDMLGARLLTHKCMWTF